MSSLRSLRGGRGGRSLGKFNSRIKNEEGTVVSSGGSNLNDDLVNKHATPITYAEREKIEGQRIAQVENMPELHIMSSVISVYSEEQIRKISVVDIVSPDISNPRLPMTKSLYDTTMGTIVSDRKCSSCQNVNCLGHFGRIPFASPIPHPMWLSVIKDLLTSVCNSCGGLLVDKDVINQNGWNYLSAHNRIQAIAEDAKGKGECPNSNKCPEIKDGSVTKCKPNPKFKLPKQEESFQIITEVKEQGAVIKSVIPVEKILAIFKCISKNDARILGFKDDARPESLIMQSLLVIPPISRPPFVADGRNNPDDLTEAYRKIVICANELRLEPDNERYKTNVYFKVKELMEGKKQKFKNVKKFMSITNRLQGKQAVPRSSLMGKRTNMCARTVISPDTSLEFGQIRIPMEWAPILTIPVKVTRVNIKAMRNLLEQGKITDIESATNKGSQRKGVTENSTINIGDKVYRHLQNGDIVVINRQPTLHKFSMMAFETVLGKERSVGLHLTYTSTFNADFDGDKSSCLQQVAATMVIRDTIVGKQCNSYLVMRYNYLVVKPLKGFDGSNKWNRRN